MGDVIETYKILSQKYDPEVSIYSLNIFYCQIYTATGLGHKFSQHKYRPFPYFLNIHNS